MNQKDLETVKELIKALEAKGGQLYHVMLLDNPELPFHNSVLLYPGPNKSSTDFEVRDVAAFAEIAPRLVAKLALDLEKAKTETRRLQSELNSGNKKVSSQLMRQHAEDTSLIGDLMIENATLKSELANAKTHAEIQQAQAREAALKEAAKAQCPYCKQERELIKPERALGWMHQPGVFGKEYVPCWSTHIQDLLQAEQTGKDSNQQ